MGTGYLQVKTSTSDYIPVKSKITVIHNGDILHTIETDENGITENIALEAPPKEQSLDPDFEGVPYSTYNVKADTLGFASSYIHGVQIFDTITSVLAITMLPESDSPLTNEHIVPMHQVHSPSQSTMCKPGVYPSEVIIPQFITPHPDKPQIPFIDYIKKAASQHAYPTWPESAIEATIYAIASLAHCNTHVWENPEHTQVFSNISEMVDLVYNRYIMHDDSPFFAEFSDGRHNTCPGLWQWGAVKLAERGHDALEILRHYYPADIQLVETHNFQAQEPEDMQKQKTGGNSFEKLLTMLIASRIIESCRTEYL